ncbi:hypothetical protein B9Q06_07355 [Candidatus Marsarchaeota G2 archaeon ECH_B_2]|uniref:Uncharacterized protein n=3 Tax=Candidatus Marsarchaeota group 2 TaxID=2203771 RepID=A0A2R6B8D3_9ARCH|nr:MAG: hypothetical protein B9Q06_07355 [Candidatus Marsarchaeota G2 archaeon ECH_B_2]PSN99407.1 MAG: hypothetical protein B9Q07_06825 [Candidatus Marsarchaeota G2 archaeon ECH_B_3]PSO01725.1 MAG: hypothetical protein B9Q05_07910 [Candidatus Marsarchaeota G2 archaeon ECH_B_1]
MNVYALVAVALFAAVFPGIYGIIYLSALSSYRRDELDGHGIRILRLGLYGHLTIFAILAITAFLV